MDRNTVSTAGCPHGEPRTSLRDQGLRGSRLPQVTRPSAHTPSKVVFSEMQEAVAHPRVCSRARVVCVQGCMRWAAVLILWPAALSYSDREAGRTIRLVPGNAPLSSTRPLPMGF